MTIYNNQGIKIETIEEETREKVMELFLDKNSNMHPLDQNNKPTVLQFQTIIDKIIKNNDDENNILVLKKEDEVIGYIYLFVHYDKLIIGNIFVKKEHRQKGYGQLLTKIAILVAENEDRDVSLLCYYPNKYLKRLGFIELDGPYYIYKHKGVKNPNFPTFFIGIEEFNQRRKKEIKKYVKNINK